MSTVVPPPPSPPPQALQAPQAPQPVVLVSNPPAALSQLPLGARLDATVLGQGGTGHVQVQTPQGVLTVQTLFPLPPNASIVLQLQSLLPQLRFQIAAINGRPPQQSLRGTSGAPSGGSAAAGRARAGTGAAAPGGSALSAVNLTVGATVVATLVWAPSMAGPRVQFSVPSDVATKTGREGVGQGTIHETSRAARPPALAGGGRGPTAPSPGSPAATAGTQHGPRMVGAPGPGGMGAAAGHAAGPAPLSGLPAGTRVTLKILSLQPAGQAAPGSPPPPSPAGRRRDSPSSTRRRAPWHWPRGQHCRPAAR